MKMDNPRHIYRDGDARIENLEYTLANEEMRVILSEKAFQKYYGSVLEVLKQTLWKSTGRLRNHSIFLRHSSVSWIILRLKKICS